MKLILDDFINDELKKFLLMQDGITNVEINNENFFTFLTINYNKKTTPEIIMKYIELFQENKYSTLLEFDKETIGNFKILNYMIDDMCCEYCYKGLVMELFKNKKIKSVKSNFNYKNPAINIEFIIEYDEDYKEKELIEYINNKIN